MYSVLFVCTGNICRSPTAEGVLRHRAREAGLDITVDSAGTTGFHAGEPPDARSINTAAARGIMLHEQRSRQVKPEDFQRFDLILALDDSHLQQLLRMKPKDARATVALFLEYAGIAKREVPDPYYGNAQDFEYVLDLIESGVTPLVHKIQQQLR